MTPSDLKRARHQLGLSVNEMAAMLGVSSIQVRRLEMRPGLPSSRPVTPGTARLILAYLDGYRPSDWPRKHT